MRRYRTLLLFVTVVALGGCCLAEWIGEQRTIEQERRDAWSAATSGSYDGSFSPGGN